MNIHLLNINALDGEGNPAVVRRCTSPGYSTKPGDADAPNQKWLPGVKTPYHFTRELLCQDMQTSRASAGECVILNDRGALDYLRGYAFDGQVIEDFYGSEYGPFAGFTKMVHGVIKDVEFSRTQIAFQFRDRWDELAKPLPVPKYGGTNTGGNGVDGTENDIKDKPMPCTVGYAPNVVPVTVNANKRIRQVHFRSCEDIPAGYSNAYPLTRDADHADAAALEAAAVSGGHYATCKALGLVKDATTTDTVITYDVKGDNVGGYVEDPAGCAARLMDIHGWSAGTDYDSVSLAAMAALNSAQVGIYDSEGRNAADLIDELLASGWFWALPNRLGLTKFGIIAAPGTPTAHIRDHKLIDLDLTTHALAGMPWSMVSLDYGKNYRVMSGTEVAGATDADRKAWLASEYRTVTSTADGEPDPDVLALHPLATAQAFKSLFVDRASALAEAQRRAAMRAAFRPPLKWKLAYEYAYMVDMGVTDALTASRLGLAQTPVFIVAIDEVPESLYVEVTGYA